MHGIDAGDSTLSVAMAEVMRMPAPMSRDLRERIVRAVEGGSSIRQAARRFAVSSSAAIKLMQRVRETGSAAPARFGGHRRPLLDAHQGELVRLVEATPTSRLSSSRPRCSAAWDSPRRCRRFTARCARSACGTKKVSEGVRTGAARRRRQAPPMARLPALHGSGPVRLSR